MSPLSAAALAFLISAAASLALIAMFRRAGHVGRDVHKPCAIEVPESVGAAIPISLALVSLLLYRSGVEEALPFALSVLIAALIGIADDFLVLKAWQKIALGTLPALPILAFAAYEPKPLVPLGDFARLTIIYPLLLPIAFTVATNGLNMFDTHNGGMLSSSIVALIAMAFAGIMIRDLAAEGELATLLSLASAGAAAGVLLFNIYPARAFNGDVGSFSLGAAIAATAVIGRVEMVALIAFLPAILNGFLKISTVGFKERRSFERPVYIEGWLMRARLSKDAPISVPSLVLSRVPLSEPELVAVLVLLTALSSWLALVTLYLTIAH